MSQSSQQFSYPPSGFGVQSACPSVSLLPPPNSLVAVFLARTVKGIGAAAAQKLCAAYPDSDDPSARSLAEVLGSLEAVATLRRAGLGAEVAEAARAAWQLATRSDPLGYEAALRGMGDGIWKRARRQFSQELPRVLAESPYRLMEASGIGWRVADDVARRLARVPLHSRLRIFAALAAASEEAGREGNCFMTGDAAVRRVSKLTRLSEAAVSAALSSVGDDEYPRGVVRDAAGRIWSEALLVAEAVCAAELRRIVLSRARVSELEAGHLARKLGPHLTDEQRQAVSNALVHGVSVITGGPGTGKSTVIAALVAAAEQVGFTPVSLCAPTALAARRIGPEASTVHRLVEMRFGSEPARAHDDEGRSYVAPRRNASRPLAAKLILVDEASLLSISLAAHLLAAVADGCHVCLIGDADQLASVEPGNFLRDLLVAGVPHVQLTRVFRFGSHLVRAAHDIREGRPPELARRFSPEASVYFCPGGRDIVARVVEVVSRRIPERFGIESNRVKVLAAMYRGPAGIDSLSRALRLVMRPGSGGRGAPPAALEPTPESSHAQRPRADGSFKFTTGDRVVWLRNDREAGLINGDELIVIAAEADGSLLLECEIAGEVYVKAESVSARLAYCQSVHKAQGQEFDAVVLVVPREHAFALHRSLLYTAVTRARKLVVIVGDGAALEAAVRRRGAMERRTLLATRLSPWPVVEE